MLFCIDICRGCSSVSAHWRHYARVCVSDGRKCWPCTCSSFPTAPSPSTSRRAITSGSTTARRPRRSWRHYRTWRRRPSSSHRISLNTTWWGACINKLTCTVAHLAADFVHTCTCRVDRNDMFIIKFCLSFVVRLYFEEAKDHCNVCPSSLTSYRKPGWISSYTTLGKVCKFYVWHQSLIRTWMSFHALIDKSSTLNCEM